MVLDTDVSTEILATLERLGAATIKTLMRETRHAFDTVMRSLDQLHRNKIITGRIPDTLPLRRISPGTVIWSIASQSTVWMETDEKQKHVFISDWDAW
ncbi:MAG TPA: hypothetical protein VKK79_06350 [Candidatus Lokiarchaeia archaeon]|nr:hypothetical protein [Candidatus Lokiarchaeia archaeon]